MAPGRELEIINSAAPLECRLVGVHPRLYFTAEAIERLRAKLGREPYASFLKSLLRQADTAAGARLPRAADYRGGDVRSVGCNAVTVAMAWLMTGQKRYYDAARAHLLTMAEYEDWTTSLQFGHWAHGSAVAWDWLYHELGAAERRDLAATLQGRTHTAFNDWASCSSFMSFCYACNHCAVILAGLTAAGCALYGEADGVAPWLKMALEKARAMCSALGPDGVSPEGIAYGQYYTDFFMKALHLIHQQLGVDLLPRCEWFRQYPTALLYQTLPRSAWRTDRLFLMFGDALGSHWCGPDYQMRRCAAVFRDARAQWLAQATDEAGAACDAPFLNLIWHDESVPARPPDDLPPFKHLEDQGIVVMRSGWDADGEVCAFRCAPPGGHKALREYNHNVAGGHMHPDAGHILIFSHGDWLIADSGYSMKMTAYENTVLVNGLGQAGEGGDWCEDLEFRRGKSVPRILRAEAGGAFDYAVGDAAPAYPAEVGLRRFLRHVAYVKPSCWIVVDELETSEPATFELHFHTCVPFESAGSGRHIARGERGAVLLEHLAPGDAAVRTLKQPILSTTTRRPDRQMDLLVLSNGQRQSRALFVTVLHAFPAGGDPEASAELKGAELTVRSVAGVRRFVLEPGRSEPGDPILRPVEAR